MKLINIYFNEIKKEFSFNEIFSYFYKTALHVAIEKRNTEMVKLLLTCDRIDINIPYVLDINNV